ncbi:MAG: hypothetical protein ACK56F_10700, partial [bacterium]
MAERSDPAHAGDDVATVVALGGHRWLGSGEAGHDPVARGPGRRAHDGRGALRGGAGAVRGAGRGAGGVPYRRGAVHHGIPLCRKDPADGVQ